MENKPHFYYPELDGLRFIAFMLVFVHNAPPISTSKLWTALHEYGWVGVDLFFCLSGFLITKLLVMEYQENGDIIIQRFYFRRILRIWPLYFFYIIFILLFPNLFPRNYTEFEFLQIAGLITFTFNFVYIYLFPFATAFFIHLWTISFEEQFYLFAPWLIRKFKMISQKGMVGALLTIFLLGTALRALFIFFQIKHPAIYTLPFTRFESIFGGVAIGLGLFDTAFRKIQSWWLFLLGIAVNAMVFILPNTYEISWNLMLSYLFVGTGMSLIVFSVTQQESQLLKKLLSNPFLDYLGKISYGLYIFHIISIMLAFRFYASSLHTRSRGLAETNSLVFFTGLIITIILSTILYQVIEKPFLKLKEKFEIIQSHPI
ncbi:MAG: acyltransferase [Anaerolineae bacterium]|nr:acyltransferase [Anaerolineae bacterium]